MTARPLKVKFLFYFAAIAILIGVSSAPYSQENSVLKVVPTGTLICVKINNLWEFDEKVADLVEAAYKVVFKEN